MWTRKNHDPFVVCDDCREKTQYIVEVGCVCGHGHRICCPCARSYSRQVVGMTLRWLDECPDRPEVRVAHELMRGD